MILKDPVVMDHALVAVGLQAPLQESVLPLVAHHLVCVRALVEAACRWVSWALVLALTVALAFAVALDLALARENYF